nr:MAG TPA: hypothetical protein [Caudoviricetes sp.]
MMSSTEWKLLIKTKEANKDGNNTNKKDFR